MPRLSAPVVIGAALVAVLGGVAVAGWQLGRPDDAPLAVEVLGPASVALSETYTGPAGVCPGYTADVPVPMRWHQADGATTMLGDDGLLLTCFGTVEEVGNLDDLVADRRAHGIRGETSDDASHPLVGAPVRVVSPFGDSVRFEYVIGLRTITEWVVERDGTIFAVGYLHDGSASRLAEVQAVMAGWRWA